MAEILGLGTKFQRKDATDVFVDIAQVVSITPPEVKIDDVKVERLDGDGVQKVLPGLIDVGEIKLKLNFDPADTAHTTLQNDAFARTIQQYKIVLPTGYSCTLTGFISNFGISEISADEVIQAEVTIKLTEKPVWS